MAGRVELSSGSDSTLIDPGTDGVIRSESATDTGSTAPSKMIAIGLRMLAPATFGAGTVAIGFRPAATVVNDAVNGARWPPPSSK